MLIEEILPFEDIRKKCGQDVKGFHALIDQLPLLLEKEPITLASSLESSWIRICHERGFDVAIMDEHKTAVKLPNGRTALLPAADYASRIHEKIGQPLFAAVAYSMCVVGNEKCVELFLAHACPNVLHLGHVEFINVNHPIPPKSQTFTTRTHYGLGLAGTLFDRMKIYAKENGVEWLTLTASADDLVPFFKRHGFDFATFPSAEKLRHMQLRWTPKTGPGNRVDFRRFQLKGN